MTKIGSAAEQKPLFTTHALLVLIGPLLVEQALVMTVGMADTMMVSRAGEAAISGVSLVDMINELIINLFAALATGGAVVVSQYLGAGEKKYANRSAGQLVLLSALLGLAVGMVCLLGAVPLLGSIYPSLSMDVSSAGTTYLRITALSYPMLALYNAGAALFRSMGNSRLSMWVSALMNLINIGGNAVCIFGLKMGVAGVAWPSVISRGVAAALILYAATNHENAVQLTLSDGKRLDGPLARRILHIGIPSAFENSLFQAGRILVVAAITAFGTVQITANAVANNLDGISIISGQAIGLAMITVVGRCVGARDYRQATRYTGRLMLWAHLTMLAGDVLILAFLPQLLGMYALSGETTKLAMLLVQIHCIANIFLWPPSFVLPNALRAANDVRFTMIVSIASMAVCRVGLSYVLALHMGWGVLGVWIAMILDWTCRTVCFVWRFMRGKWKTKYAPG